jgi:hypothetical protein
VKVSDCFRVGVEEEVEMLPYAGVRSVSIESCWFSSVVHTVLGLYPHQNFVKFLCDPNGSYYC